MPVCCFSQGRDSRTLVNMYHPGYLAGSPVADFFRHASLRNISDHGHAAATPLLQHLTLLETLEKHPTWGMSRDICNETL